MQFRDNYAFLSNMYESPIAISYAGNTYRYKSVEAAFQACKCPERMHEFQTLTGPQAKQLGRQVQLRPDWEAKKVSIMQQLVKIKFDQNPQLKQALLATGQEPIAEENTWNDKFWGVCNGQGENMLGRILMYTRSEYQKELQASQQTQPVQQTEQPAQQKKSMQILMDFSDIYDLPQGPDEILCITTNGNVKKDGHAVMGKGIALSADQRFNISGDLGKLINNHGNHTYDLGMRVDKKTGRQVHIVTIPTKHDWKENSDIALVRRSMEELVNLCNRLNIKKCYTTAPGCALGNLDWNSQVKPILDELFDDRFIIADWKLQEAAGIQSKGRQQGLEREAVLYAGPKPQIPAQPAKPAQPTQPAQTAQPVPENKGLTLCFTGQRPKDLVPKPFPGGYTAEPYRKFKADLVLYLNEMYNAGYRNFISGGAQGFDQIAFWAVHELKQTHPDIKNITYLPFKGQESRWNLPGAFNDKAYQKMMSLADHVVWTSEMQGIPVDLEKGTNIPKALDMRNHAMVDDSDLVIALYRDPTGMDPNKRGSGTNNCMLYAKNQGLPVYQIVYDNDAQGNLQARSQVNITMPDKPRMPKKTPMWIQAMQPAQQQPTAADAARDMSDVNAEYNNIHPEDDFPENANYDIDF